MKSGIGAPAAMALGLGDTAARIVLRGGTSMAGKSAAAAAAVGVLGPSLPVLLPCWAWPLLGSERVRRRRVAWALAIVAVHLVFSFSVCPRVEPPLLVVGTDATGTSESAADSHAFSPRTWTATDLIVDAGAAPARVRSELWSRGRTLLWVLVGLLPFVRARWSPATPWLGAGAVVLASLVGQTRLWSLAVPIAILPAIALHEWIARPGRARPEAARPERERLDVTRPGWRAARGRRWGPAVAASLASALVGALLAVGPWALRTLPRGETVAVGQVLRADLETLDGQPVPLARAPQDVTLLVAWADWCGYCPGQIADMEALRDELGRDRVRVLALNVLGAEDARTSKRHAWREPTLVVIDPTVEAPVERRALPTTYVLDGSARTWQVIEGSYADGVADAATTARLLLRRAGRLDDAPPR